VAPRPERGARSASLRPREHGAYAALAFPLASGVLLGGTTLPALAFAAATLVLFLAHEPAAVLLGMRGGRARAEHGERARRALLGLSGVAVVATALFLASAEPRARATALVPAALAAIATLLLGRGCERTTAGEVVVSAALATTALPTALSGPGEVRLALLLAAVWTVVLVLGVTTARAIILEAKAAGRAAWEGRSARLGAASAAALSLLALAGRWAPPAMAVALLLASAATLALSVGRPHPRHLRRVGWTLVAIDVLTFAVLLAAPRPG
jgi:hypothetical protein